MGSTPGYKVGRDELGLTAMDRAVIKQLREGNSQSQAARNLGATRQRVNQIVKRIQADEALRHLLPSDDKPAATKESPTEATS